MKDDWIIVTIEGNGAHVYEMDRVLVRNELPDFEGALVVVDLHSENPIQGQINFVDLKALEQYAWDNRVKFKTGEFDPIGLARLKQETEEERNKMKERLEKFSREWGERYPETHE